MQYFNEKRQKTTTFRLYNTTFRTLLFLWFFYGIVKVIKVIGGEKMKKVWQILKKFAPAITACLTLVLTINANSSVCYFFNQPEPPKGLDDFKRIR